MAISSNTAILASDLTSLRNSVSALYANRASLLTTGQKKYGTTAIHTTFTQYDIHPDYIQFLVNACLVINDIPNLKWYDPDHTSGDYLYKNDKIFGDGSTTNLLTWISTRAGATGTSSAHGCRGACVGICYTGCSGVAKGSQGAANDYTTCGCGSYTGGNCMGTCSGTNLGKTMSEINQAGFCDNCGTMCHNHCHGGCYGCVNWCNTTCLDSCNTTCYNTCKNTCDTGCVNGCAAGCSNGCYGSATGTCYGCSGSCASCSSTCKSQVDAS